MFGTLLKFCLPLSIAGTGVATALGVSSSTSTENNVSTSSPVTVSHQETQAQVSLQPEGNTVPTLETVLATSANVVSGQEDRQELDTKLQTLPQEELPKTSELETPKAVAEEPEGNCQIIDPATDIFESLEKDSANYYTVSCKNKGNDTFLDNWKGLFLKTLFSNQEVLNTNKKFDLNVTTDMGAEDDSDMSDEFSEDEENLYGVTISSSKFANNELIGRWNYGDVGDESVAIINLTSFLNGEKIYLFDFQ